MLLTKPTVTDNIVNFYGSESDFFLKLLNPYLQSTVTTTCNLNTCPKPTQLLHSLVIPSLGNSFDIYENQLDSILTKAVADWVDPGMSYCKKKFADKPPVTVPHHEDIAINIDCDKTAYWHCSGIRQHSPHQFVNLKNFLIFSVDLLSRQGMPKLSQVPSTVKLFGKEFEFHSATLWNGSHYICTFFYNEM